MGRVPLARAPDADGMEHHAVAPRGVENAVGDEGLILLIRVFLLMAKGLSYPALKLSHECRGPDLMPV